jgi:hypothetical protein
VRPFLLCLLVSGCQPGYYVYGDSLTSPGHSWANQLRTHHRQVHAVPGLRLVDLTLPHWLKPTAELPGVLLALGVNDAGSGVPVTVFEAHLVSLIDQAHAQGLTVACLVIPYWPGLPHTGAPFDPYRTAQATWCPQLVTVVVTPDVMADSPDGLHWGPVGHTLITQQIEKQL